MSEHVEADELNLGVGAQITPEKTNVVALSIWKNRHVLKNTVGHLEACGVPSTNVCVKYGYRNGIDTWMDGELMDKKAICHVGFIHYIVPVVAEEIANENCSCVVYVEDDVRFLRPLREILEGIRESPTPIFCFGFHERPHSFRAQHIGAQAIAFEKERLSSLLVHPQTELPMMIVTQTNCFLLPFACCF